MKRMILTGILAIGTGATCLLAQAPAQKGPAPKSKGEMEALQALQAAGGDPDKSIAAAENLITKFADTSGGPSFSRRSISGEPSRTCSQPASSYAQ